MHNASYLWHMLSVGMVVHPGMFMQAFWHSRLLKYTTRNFEHSEFLEGCLDAFHIGTCPCRLKFT